MVLLLLHQFQAPLIHVLLAAAAVTLALGDYRGTGVITAALVISAAIGFVQELRAQAAIRGPVFGDVLLAVLAHLTVLYVTPLQDLFLTTAIAPFEWG